MIRVVGQTAFGRSRWWGKMGVWLTGQQLTFGWVHHEQGLGRVLVAVGLSERSHESNTVLRDVTVEVLS